MLKTTVAAIVVSLLLTGTAWAQTTPEQKSDAKPPENTAQSRHDHARDHKQGSPASQPTDADKAKKKKKPLHDHGKTHKQQ